MSGRPAEPSDVAAWKREQRVRLLEARLAVQSSRRAVWNATIAGTLESLLGESGCSVLGFYWPFKGEFDARALAKHLFARGLALALPVVVGRAHPLEFRLWEPGAAMEPSVYRIPVPKERRLATPDCLLIPVVGFDFACYRLGYGGGYYDRTLAALVPRPLTIGVGYELSRLPSVHPQAHDQRLDVIVTEDGIQRCSGGEGP